MGDYIVQPLADPDKKGGSAGRLKMQTNGSRIATQRRKPISLMGRKIKAKQKQQAVNKTDNQVESISQDTICHETKGGQMLLNTASLSNKYQPKLFQEIVGHSIVVKTLSNAIQKKKIAPLYLFHGPNGTGKTSTARVFAMALNCESTFHNTKPCCSCKGCSRSLYTMDLCSANSISGFEKIKTLLHNTSFAQAIPGLKVFIIEECHLLTVAAWDELMRLVEGPYACNLVFMLITTDANSIAGNISSRCHKFYFRKLNDEDVTEKLSKILVRERMGIEEEALKLIVAKSEGSLRDAENILDQLALLGTTINTSIAQQLVGLIPESKLLKLLAVAVSGDSVNTIRYAKKLSECVEPASFVSQLANLITNILSEGQVLDSSSSPAQKTRSQLSKTQSARLCYILKLLVETEKQLRSSTDQTASIIAAAFLNMASVKKASSRIPTRSSSSSTEIAREAHMFVQHQRHDDEKSSRRSLSDMEKLWKDVVKGIESSHTQKFLHDQAKLALLCISRINAIVHLTFTRHEDKTEAEISKESLVKALEVAIGCPVSLHMSLEQDGKNRTMSGSHPLAFDHYSDPNRNLGQSDSLRLTKSKSCSTSRPPLRKGRNLNTVIFEDPTPEYHRTNFIQAAGDPINATQLTMRAPRHRWLSLSSIPQSDASVEPYSQDVIYENSNKDGGDDTVRKNPKFQTGFSKTSRDQQPSNPAWYSVDICC